MSEKKYKLSFSVGGIFYRESLIIADLYLNNNDWDFVKREVLEKNILQLRTESSAKRIVREIISRLRLLSKEELLLLMTSNRLDQNCILWISICRNYQFIREFSTEVIREQFLNFQYNIDYNNYDVFFEKKSEWCERMGKISLSTKRKLRQVLFKMLREVEIIDDNNSIIPIVLSPQLVDVIASDSAEDFYIFPTLEVL